MSEKTRVRPVSRIFQLKQLKMANVIRYVCRRAAWRLPFVCNHSSSSACEMENPVQNQIENKLRAVIKPSHLEVVNESHKHNVPRGSETHFKVIIVADAFDGMPLIARHRLIMDLLKQELEGGVHALSIHAKTSQQWSSSGGIVPQSPPCLGGSKA